VCLYSETDPAEDTKKKDSSVESVGLAPVTEESRNPRRGC
jgi:hypothetical protein